MTAPGELRPESSTHAANAPFDARALFIDAAEIETRLDELGAVGNDRLTGLWRGVYTPSWHRAVDLITTWFAEAGLSIRQDAVGNIYGRLEGREDGPPVLTGSHVDTVRRAGKYDGALGVVASLAAVKALKQHAGAPRRPLEVVVTCDEEGSRFATDFWGARAIIGRIERGEAERHRDETGVTLADAMRSVGLDPARIGDARRDAVAAWLELHVEQSGTLEAEGIEVGIAQGITSRRQVRIRVVGQQDHAGPTPMRERRDPMAGAAEMILHAIQLAERTGPPAVCTVGRVDADPGVFNVVPGVVTFTLDTRHPEDADLEALLAEIDRFNAGVAAQRGLSIEITKIKDRRSTLLDSHLTELAERAATCAGVRWKRMASMAGHDTEVMAARWPSLLLFVPSHAGRSHSPEEFTSIEQIIPGVRVLAGTLFECAFAG